MQTPLLTSYKSIQTLRGIAAMLVALMHLIFFYVDGIKYLGGDLPKMASFLHFKGFGGVGIQIFFVISGFIMAYLHATGETKSFGSFVFRRLTRVVPLYWLATIAWAYVLNPSTSFTFENVVKSLFFIPTVTNTTILGPGWSLNFEMFFYLVFGVVALIFRASFLWVGVTFLVFNTVAQMGGHFVFGLYSDPIVWNFVAGIAIFHVHRFSWVRRESLLLLLVGVALLLLSIYWHVPNDSKGIKQFLPWGLPSMMIVLGAVSLEAQGKGARLFGSKLMLLLGNASYALYLVHGLCFVGVSNWLLYSLKLQEKIGPDGAILVYLLVCCVISILVHILVEKPITKGTRFIVGSFARRSLVAHRSEATT
jgi:exopolysaccharide production protein ExoZ